MAICLKLSRAYVESGESNVGKGAGYYLKDIKLYQQ